MTNTVFEGEGLKLRLETIAINAVIAAQMAKGRAHMPWIDDDTHRKSCIAGYLNLAMTDQIPAEEYHYQVVSQQQAKTDPKIDALEKTLADALNADPEIQQLKLPTKKAA